MNIVVVGTLTQKHASKLDFCSRDADNIIFVKQQEELFAHETLSGELDLVLTGDSVDHGKLRDRLSAAGLDTPVFTVAESALPAVHPSDNFVSGEQSDALSIAGSSGLRLGSKLADVERQLILETLTHCAGNRTWAADILGISIRTLRNKLLQYSDQGMQVTAPGERRSRNHH